MSALKPEIEDPADPSLGRRMVPAALRAGADVSALAHAGLEAASADDLNTEDPDTLASLADRGGLESRRGHG